MIFRMTGRQVRLRLLFGHGVRQTITSIWPDDLSSWKSYMYICCNGVRQTITVHVWFSGWQVVGSDWGYCLSNTMTTYVHVWFSGWQVVRSDWGYCLSNTITTYAYMHICCNGIRQTITSIWPDELSSWKSYMYICCNGVRQTITSIWPDDLSSWKSYMYITTYVHVWFSGWQVVGSDWGYCLSNTMTT
jgi:hypothetical protein